MTPRFLLLLSLLFGVLAGAAAAQSRMLHENGLSLVVPEGFSAKPQGPGLFVFETGALRTPMAVTITLETDTYGVPSNTVRVSDGSFRKYSLRADSGGSGGPFYYVRVERKVGARFIRMFAAQQSELGAPNFDRAWEIFDSANIE